MKAESSQFIPQALRVINDAVICVIGMTDIHVRKSPLPKKLASRARTRLRALEKMLRRVIVLMALAMAGQVRSVPKMFARIRVLDGAASSRSAPLKQKQGRLPKPPVPMLPAYGRETCSRFDFSHLPRRNTPGPVQLHRLVVRIINLQRILKNPAPMARRLAFYHDRLKRRGATPRPPPDIKLGRASAELALVAGALPIELRRALAVWHDTS